MPATTLKLYLVTFNMGGTPVQKKHDLQLLLPPISILHGYDLICIATQECEKTIQQSFLNASKQHWEHKLNSYFQPTSFVFLQSCTLLAMHLILFVNTISIKESQISNLYCNSVACGLLNQVGNKGACAIYFKLFDHFNLLFINCHLTAHQENIKERRENLDKIFAHIYATNVFDTFDGIFLLGDFNYRINGNRKVVDTLIRLGYWEVLLANDQLQMERTKYWEDSFVLSHFKESSIHFKPTYKFDRHSNHYDSSKKQRVPAYTDRILYFERKDQSITVLEYKSVEMIKLSDHKPVYATMMVALETNPMVTKEQPIDNGNVVVTIHDEPTTQQTLPLQTAKNNSTAVCLIN